MAADGVGIAAQLGDVNALAGLGEPVEPLDAALEHFEGAAIVAAFDLVVGDADLEDGAVEVADGAGGFHPECFEEVVLLVVLAAIEEFGAGDG